MRYRPGEHLVISDISGQKIRSSDSIKDWRGLIMERDNWSEKHPQLDIKPRAEDISVQDARPRQSDTWAAGQGPNDTKIEF
jgi:hypothetical protein